MDIIKIKKEITDARNTTDLELFTKFDISGKSKDALALVTIRLLGYSRKELLAEGYIVRTLLLDKNNFIKESISFPVSRPNEFIKEEFENSELAKLLDKKFLFITFKKGDKYNYLTGDVFEWKINKEDLKIVKTEWLLYQKCFIDGIVLNYNSERKIITNNLPKKSETQIIHMRPHALKAAYKLKNGLQIGDIHKNAYKLPNGEWMTKQCFWLNNSYIKKIIKI